MSGTNTLVVCLCTQRSYTFLFRLTRYNDECRCIYLWAWIHPMQNLLGWKTRLNEGAKQLEIKESKSSAEKMESWFEEITSSAPWSWHEYPASGSVFTFTTGNRPAYRMSRIKAPAEDQLGIGSNKSKQAAPHLNHASGIFSDARTRLSYCTYPALHDSRVAGISTIALPMNDM